MYRLVLIRAILNVVFYLNLYQLQCVFIIYPLYFLYHFIVYFIVLFAKIIKVINVYRTLPGPPINEQTTYIVKS